MCAVQHSTLPRRHLHRLSCWNGRRAQGTLLSTPAIVLSANDGHDNNKNPFKGRRGVWRRKSELIIVAVTSASAYSNYPSCFLNLLRFGTL
jgi:hypothetical protein